MVATSFSMYGEVVSCALFRYCHDQHCASPWAMAVFFRIEGRLTG